MNIRPLKDYEEIKAQLGDTSPKFQFNPEKLEIEKEPLIGDMFEGTDEYVENRVQSYKDFLKSDLCRQIMEIENIPYQGVSCNRSIHKPPSKCYKRKTKDVYE